jgi:soluble lytic murein transglycosylase-like protein
MSTSFKNTSISSFRAIRLAALLCAGIVVTSGMSYAAKTTYTYRGADGTMTFSDAPIENGQVVRSSYKSTLRTPVAANPCKGLSNAQLDAKGEKLDNWFAQAARAYAIALTLIKAVARAESCFDPKAVSIAGAQGLMQLMPATARAMEVADSFDTRQNLNGGARYLARMLARYSNDLDLALAAYNAGPGNVDRYNGVPPFNETRQYIKSVKAHRARYEALQTIVAQNESP